MKECTNVMNPRGKGPSDFESLTLPRPRSPHPHNLNNFFYIFLYKQPLDIATCQISTIWVKWFRRGFLPWQPNNSTESHSFNFDLASADQEHFYNRFWSKSALVSQKSFKFVDTRPTMHEAKLGPLTNTLCAR